jgi:glycosyltransferase involved in cell wall biosynthesis
MALGIPKANIEIVPNSVNPQNFQVLPQKGSFKKKFNIKLNKKMVLYIGRIHTTKGIDLLVNAINYLSRNKNEDIVLVIIGPDDGYLSQLNKLVDTLGLRQITHIFSFLKQEDKLSALQDADVFVTPSFYGFPMTFLESCAVGTPIVTTTKGDILDWINNNVGLVVPPTFQDVALAIKTILIDRELYKFFSSNCKQMVCNEFSVQKTVIRLENIYHNLNDDFNA